MDISTVCACVIAIFATVLIIAFKVIDIIDKAPLPRLDIDA